jgi:hypothetical protein
LKGMQQRFPCALQWTEGERYVRASSIMKEIAMPGGGLTRQIALGLADGLPCAEIARGLDRLDQRPRADRLIRPPLRAHPRAARTLGSFLTRRTAVRRSDRRRARPGHGHRIRAGWSGHLFIRSSAFSESKASTSGTPRFRHGREGGQKGGTGSDGHACPPWSQRLTSTYPGRTECGAVETTRGASVIRP